MKVTIGQTISYEVDKVDVKSVRVLKAKDGKLSFIVQYNWLNAAGEIVRNDVARYSQDQIGGLLTAASQDATPFVAALTALLPAEGTNQSLFISLAKDPATFRGVWMMTADGVNTWPNKTYTAEELTAASFDVAAFNGVVSMLASALVVG